MVKLILGLKMQKKMLKNKEKVYIIIILISLLFVIFVLTGCNKVRKVEHQSKQKQIEKGNIYLLVKDTFDISTFDYIGKFNISDDSLILNVDVINNSYDTIYIPLYAWGYYSLKKDLAYFGTYNTISVLHFYNDDIKPYYISTEMLFPSYDNYFPLIMRMAPGRKMNLKFQVPKDSIRVDFSDFKTNLIIPFCKSEDWRNFINFVDIDLNKALSDSNSFFINFDSTNVFLDKYLSNIRIDTVRYDLYHQKIKEVVSAYRKYRQDLLEAMDSNYNYLYSPKVDSMIYVDFYNYLKSDKSSLSQISNIFSEYIGVFFTKKLYVTFHYNSKKDTCRVIKRNYFFL